MMKTLAIALKDTLIAFRDRNALLLMIGAPLLIALVMGMAFGGQGADTSPISRIPLVIVNLDAGEFGESFAGIMIDIEVETTEGTQALFSVTEMDDLEAAKAEIESGKARGVIYLPEDFSANLQAGSEGDGERTTAVVQVFTDPAATVSPGIVRGVAGRIAIGFSSVVIGNVVAVEQALEAAAEIPIPAGEMPPLVIRNLENLAAIVAEETAGFGETEGARDRISVTASSVGEGEGFNLLNYFVPSMAIFFLMFAVFDGTRSILEEERDGTLHRLMSTPTSKGKIILGKIGGTFMTGTLQFVILVAVSGLAFGVNWGQEPFAVTLLVLATVSAATSLGALIASFARNASQAGVLGSAVTLIFAILGGNFIDFRTIPDWLAPVSKATINRWALEGFFNLTLLGYNLQEVSLNIIVLFGMAAVFFSLSVVFFKRRFVR